MIAAEQSELIQEIEEKYQALGQNPQVYLEGLKYSKLVTYWDYCEIDTLLSLQKTRTTLPDEDVFIMYHQITELTFKMILSEIRQIANHPKLNRKFFTQRLRRINRYFSMLTFSFDIMRDGMEPEQYMKFRTTLTPASGFQSAQYRMIEICCTPLINLVNKGSKTEISQLEAKEQFQHIYWQQAGTSASGDKSLTLQLFEEKYLNDFIQLSEEYKQKNLWERFKGLPKKERSEELVDALRQLDHKVNVEWPLVHYRTAKKYLESDQTVEEATGGSDWKKYLHPKFQRRIFFPELWSDEELENWGKK